MMMRNWFPRFCRVALLLLAALPAIAACAADPPSPPVPAPALTASPPADPRPFAMGFSAVPGDLTADSHLALFHTAAAFGDAVMIQRSPPWPELLADVQLSDDTRATIIHERALLDQLGLDLLFAIDPFDPTDRSRLSSGAPGASFADPAVVDAYLRYVDLILEHYRPRWLALAVDMDQIARANPTDFASFEATYRQAYARAKAQRPDIAVFATFQLEDLQGLLQWSPPHPPQWPLVQRLSDALDLLAVSTFPSFVFPFVTEIPAEYFSRLHAFEKPLALVPVGYAASPGRGGLTYGTESGQASFLRRVLAEAHAQQWELLIWLASRDPAYATESPYDLVAQMGLRDIAGNPRAAWSEWIRAAWHPWWPAASAAVTAEPALPIATERSSQLPGGDPDA